MKKILSFLIGTCFITNIVRADAVVPAASPAPGCPNPVTAIQVGKPAGCDGYLFTKQAESQNRALLEKGSLAQQQNTVLNQEIAQKNIQITDLTNAYNTEQQKSEVFSKETLALANQIQKEKEDQTLKNVLLVGGSVAATILLFLATSAVVKAQ
jgi:uncharacterized membrane protein